jgi:hypothetical protein
LWWRVRLSGLAWLKLRQAGGVYTCGDVCVFEVLWLRKLLCLVHLGRRRGVCVQQPASQPRLATNLVVVSVGCGCLRGAWVPGRTEEGQG